MLRELTKDRFKLLSLFALLCIGCLAAACHHGGGSQSGDSKQSSPTSSTAPSSAGGEFEGLISMRISSEEQKGMEMTYFLKGRHTRIEMSGGSDPANHAVMLWDLDGAKMITLMPSRKMYWSIDLKDAAEGMKNITRGMRKSDTEPEKFPKLTSTGKQETVAGHNCEHWLVGDQQELDMCVAKGLGYFGAGGQSAGAGSLLKGLAFSPKLMDEAASHPEWVKLLEGGAFPLKITATEGGKVTMNMEATKIERKSLDDSLFTIPADYKEINMGSMTGGGKQ